MARTRGTVSTFVARPGLLVAGLLLVGGSVAGCGGDPPADASEKEFCDTYNSLFADGSLEDVSDEQIVEEIKAWGKRLEETGTPESMSEEARAGFDRTLQELKSLDPDAGPEDFEKLEEDASDEVRQQMRAFDEFSMSTCGSPLDDVELPELPELSPKG